MTEQEFQKFLDEMQEKSHQKARKQFLLSKAKTMSLEEKEDMALIRIREFLKKCDEAKLTPVISFSGGKDSCVLRHLVSRVRKGIKLETAGELFHPEIAKFLRTIPKDEITIFKPLMPFKKIVKKEGFPVLSKEVAQRIHNVRNSKTLGKWTKACFGLRKSRPIPKKYLHFLDEELVKYNISSKCCSLIKGAVKYSKSPKFVGTTIEESELRRTSWLKHGCNLYTKKTWASRPISLFTEKDIWDYIKKYNVPYSKAYGNYGNKWKRTGCICCGFGLAFEQALSKKGYGRSRIELLFDNYPALYKHYIHDLGLKKPFCDAGIDLNVNDEKYRRYFNLRQKKIKAWYSEKNFKNNLKRVLKQIEKRTNSKFTNTEKNKIYKLYGA